MAKGTSEEHSNDPGALAWLGNGRDLSMLLAIVGVVAIMVIPLPSLLLDLLLTVSIAVSLLIMLTAIYVGRPLDFSVFPSLLLITTLFRLGLNVASTRLILLAASDGSMMSSKIVQTFGRFVVGGNVIIGIIVFLILVIINFIVITKGAGRIAEVTARFTLDGLPGKQMAIDAELASGALTDEQAKTRRKELEGETTFYGAMDGASKFVRGDAIAGLIITAINLVGGLIIAVSQGGMGFGEAATTYSILTVGDGLVSQIPALLISTGAGIIVTRAASSTDLGRDIHLQILDNKKVLMGSSVVLFLLGLIPGMPFFLFLALAGLVGWMGWRVHQNVEAADSEAASSEASAKTTEKDGKPSSPEDLLVVEALTLEIGFGLVSMVNDTEAGGLPQRFVQMRRQFADELGIIVPPIHIRDNLSLAAGAYRLLLKGSPVGGGELLPGRLLAIDPGNVREKIKGRVTRDPTFGLEALWIDKAERYRAEGAGYTVVELDGVVTTHVSELVRQNASRLLGWQELQDRLDALRELAPKLVEELVGNLVSFSTLLKVLRTLLGEGVSIRDLLTILEAIAEHAGTTKSVIELTNFVRARLSSQISVRLMNESGTIFAALLDHRLEDRLRQCLVTQHGEPVLACDLMTAQGMFKELEELLGQFAAKDAEPVILAPPDIRAPLQQFLAQFFPNIAVICHREVSQQAKIISVGQLRLLESEGEPAFGGVG